MMTVVAALIQRDGRWLICQRRRGGAFPLKWEFPGGKVRSGETPAKALARELSEELGITAPIGHERYRTRHRYAEHPEELELIFFSADAGETIPQNLAFEQVQWARPEELAGFDFLPADRELVERLASGALRP